MGLYTRTLQPRLLNASMGSSSTLPIRREVCAGLVGEVIEVGYGSGHNQPYLPSGVRAVTAIEPSAVAWRLSADRRAASAIPVVLAGDDAQHLSWPDDHFDAALCTWTLCGIDDPAAALRQLRRVLKPGGMLHFVEHGLAPDPGVVRWQRRGNGLNHRVAGCLLDRDVRRLIEDSGLRIVEFTSYYHSGSPRPAGYFSQGRAAA